jgi:hypothetical protein
VTVAYGAKFCGVPCHTSSNAPTTEIGNKTYSHERVRSTQKLPNVCAFERVKPRIAAIATARPTAAATKFCQANPAICAR